jgi:hypothetical protein
VSLVAGLKKIRVLCFISNCFIGGRNVVTKLKLCCKSKIQGFNVE